MGIASRLSTSSLHNQQVWALSTRTQVQEADPRQHDQEAGVRADRTLTADIAAKSLRKAQMPAPAPLPRRCCKAASRPVDVIAEAALSAQPKAAKPTPR